MGRKSESYFSQSKAHINFITEYRPTYFKSETYSFDPMENIYCPRFPSLIKSDNTVWHLASAYFNHLLIDQRKSTALLESVASDLIDFLRFLEDTELDILYLPPRPEKRVTYQFHTTLLQRIRSGLISPSTARQRMNRVLRFYDFLLAENIFTPEELKNRPYEKIKTYVSCVTSLGDIYKKQVNSSNLKIMHSPRLSYGKDENYVFLTKHGNPYYTSIKEIEDHNLKVFSNKIRFSIHKGNAARQALSKIINLMLKSKENIRLFSLHDLRATFGVDLLISAAKHVDDIDQIIPYIQQSMGHRNVMNTIHYIRYITFTKASKDLEKKFENILYKFEEKDN